MPALEGRRGRRRRRSSAAVPAINPSGIPMSSATATSVDVCQATAEPELPSPEAEGLHDRELTPAASHRGDERVGERRCREHAQDRGEHQREPPHP